jgi:hypothetical protein
VTGCVSEGEVRGFAQNRGEEVSTAFCWLCKTLRLTPASAWLVCREIPYYCGVSKVLRKFSLMANATEKEWFSPGVERQHIDLPVLVFASSARLPPHAWTTSHPRLCVMCDRFLSEQNSSIYLIELSGDQEKKAGCGGAFQVQFQGQVSTWAAGSDAARADWVQHMLAAGSTLRVPALADWMQKKGRWNTSFKRRFFRTEKHIGQDALAYYESIHKFKPNGSGSPAPRPPAPLRCKRQHTSTRFRLVV